jgi:hypothetical protein
MKPIEPVLKNVVNHVKTLTTDAMDNNMKRLIISIALLAIASITTSAQNWPSFRGPNASGVAEGTNPPTTWDLEKSQHVIWKTSIPGLSHASPIV